jgi:predicted amidophosphoribosyltransferase
MKKLLCPNCMNPYYEGTVTRCPKCGESLTNNTDFTTGITSEDSM